MADSETSDTHLAEQCVQLHVWVSMNYASLLGRREFLIIRAETTGNTTICLKKESLTPGKAVKLTSATHTSLTQIGSPRLRLPINVVQLLRTDKVVAERQVRHNVVAQFCCHCILDVALMLSH